MNKTDKSIRVFYDKNHYNDWLFIYLPQADRGGLLTGPVSLNGAPNPNLSGAPGQSVMGAAGSGMTPNAGQSPGVTPPQPPQNPGQTPQQE